MSELGGLPKRLSEAVEAYVGQRDTGGPVSLKRIAKATGYMMPELCLTDKELADLVAAKLVAMGCDIDFNMSEVSDPWADGPVGEGIDIERGSSVSTRATRARKPGRPC